MELLLRRRRAASRENRLTGIRSAHDWQRAQAAAEAAVRQAMLRGERVVLVSDVVRQAEEQFMLRLSTGTAAHVLRQRINGLQALRSDARDHR
ncbi:hypothetical protein [Streptomyces sp. NPDC029554]|uniref:hypothetical protein n=1 Tax=Streptomyces sp. NPDC029554 TaxID=3155126 RepID=UPI0033EE0080